MRRRSTTIFIIILLILALLLGYNYFARPFIADYQEESEKEALQKQNQEAMEVFVEEKIAVLEKLTTEEKIGQIMAIPFVLSSDNKIEELGEDGGNYDLSATRSAQLQELKPGFVTVFGSRISLLSAQDQVQALTKTMVAQRLPPLLAVDHEGGRVQRFSGEGFTLLPAFGDFCQLETEERQTLLTSSAQELSHLGINIVFAPVVDIKSRVLGDRSCQDYQQALETSREYVAAFGNRRIMAVLKHFPGLGQTTKDLHSASNSVDLVADDTMIFTELLNLYPNIGVMTAHLNLNDRLDDQPCSLSEECLSVFPSDYPMVLLFTDALEMKALSAITASMLQEHQWRSLSDDEFKIIQKQKDWPLISQLVIASLQAMRAGNHVLVYGQSVNESQLQIVKNELVAWYDQDPIFKEKVDLAVTKIIAVKNTNNQL